MTLELTPDQLRKLTSLVAMGDWLINSNRQERLEPFQELTQLLYKKLYEAGVEDWIEKKEEQETYLPTRKFEEENMEMVQAYNQENFWEGLVHHLGDRDFYRKYRKDQIEAMDQMEIYEIRQKMAKKYQDEVVEHGIQRIIINPRLGAKKNK